ncbi:hypothetical protein BHE74_00053021 [Ensete ventricosum]|nr:hypothetical protein BHE74_00053021 [Ensete ventricosum]
MRGSQLPTLDRGSRTRADLRATEEGSRRGRGGVVSSIAHRFLRPSLLASRSAATAVAFCFGRAAGRLFVLGATRKHDKGGLTALRWAAAGWRVVGGDDALSEGIEVSVRMRLSNSSASGIRSVVVRASGKNKNDHGNHSSSGKSLCFSPVSTT